MKSNFLEELKELYYVKNSTFRFNARTKDNLSFVQRLKLTDCHRVHRGCVNTIAWDDSGSYILSGSDDLRLVVLDPFNGKIVLSHKTKHPTNIFCAKFLPQSQNEQVVSSSAAGHIFHTYFDREDKGVSFGFNCHTGAAYELATIPNDPFVFMSCGEDRTIRWFDLRVKSSCNKEECSEDILVNCSRPVMSMSLHPTRPFEFAAGCSDSTVRIFDRRFISPASNGRTLKESCLLKFTCPQLDNQHHRITSLLYGGDGTELLVSYSSEHLYLFDFKKDGRRFKSLLKTPLTKNEPAPSDASLVLGSDRFKASPSLPSPPQSSSSSSSSSPPSEQAQPRSKTVHGNPFIAGVSKQLPIKRLRLRGDWSDTGPQARPKKEKPTGEQSSGVASVMERMSNLMTRWLERNLVRDSSDDNDASASNEAADMEVDNNDGDDDDSDEYNNDASDRIEVNVIGNTGTASNTISSIDEQQLQGARDALQNESSESSASALVQEEPIIKVVQRRKNYRVPSDFGQTSGRFNDVQPDHNAYGDDDNDLSGMRRVGTSNEERDGCTIGYTSQSSSFPEDVSRKQQRQSAMASTAGPSRPAIFISPLSSAGSVRDKAAKTIQAFFSNRFKGKDDKLCGEKRDSDVVAGRSDDEDDEDSQEFDASSYRPAVTKCYKGHRNSRTLIKKASFWGTKYVMSGSDCGHIFVWDKETTELVMFLEGDNHVVNCLQPHPSLPVLASSGIDYDVKIWMPVSEYPAFNQNEAYQVMNRNEVMLEETKGTVTVPAEFMFRLFSSLSRIRRGNRLQSSRNNSSLD